MPKSPTWLLEFQSNVYSQTGEDGIIGKILDSLSTLDRWCVEFGAWDGIHLSNTRNLIESKGYSAVLIEGSKEKFKELDANYSSNKRVVPLNLFVGVTQEDNLDSILKSTPIPRDFDFLSIDIDGNDYHVWKAALEYRPKLVCIEFNPTIPTEVEFVQSPDPFVNQGSSLRSLVELGKQKGYELISVLPYNAFFVRSDLFLLFEIENNSPETLRLDRSFITYLFVGYDGKVFLRGCTQLTWHSLPMEEAKIQRLPRFLQKYPGNYSRLEGLLFDIYQFYPNPWKMVRRLGKRILEGLNLIKQEAH